MWSKCIMYWKLAEPFTPTMRVSLRTPTIGFLGGQKLTLMNYMHALCPICAFNIDLEKTQFYILKTWLLILFV